MKKKIYTVDDIKKMTTSIERFEGPAKMEDEFGNLFNIDEVIELAEKDIETKKSETANLNLRWTRSKIERIKKIAAKRGLKYQTFIKNILDQVIEKEEKQIS